MLKKENKYANISNGYVSVYIVYINSEEDDSVTDKELKKLSRLELLELLLTESRENERLREELEKLKQENTIKKSAQHLSQTSENLGETSEKLGAALQQVYSIINGLDKIKRIPVEEITEETSEEAEELRDEEDFSEPEEIEEPEEAEESEKAEESAPDEDDDDEAVNSKQKDISQRLDAALQLISTRIQELDRLAGIVEADKAGLARYDADEN